MFELRPFEHRNNHVAAYDPWDQMERAFFGDGSWGRGLSEFKTDIQDKGEKITVTLSGRTVSFHRPHGHTLPKDEVAQIRDFLKECGIEK